MFSIFDLTLRSQVDSAAQIYADATSSFVYVSTRDLGNGSIKLYAIDMRTMQCLPPLIIKLKKN